MTGKYSIYETPGSRNSDICREEQLTFSESVQRERIRLVVALRMGGTEIKTKVKWHLVGKIIVGERNIYRTIDEITKRND